MTFETMRRLVCAVLADLAQPAAVALARFGRPWTVKLGVHRSVLCLRGLQFDEQFVLPLAPGNRLGPHWETLQNSSRWCPVRAWNWEEPVPVDEREFVITVLDHWLCCAAPND